MGAIPGDRDRVRRGAAVPEPPPLPAQPASEGPGGPAQNLGAHKRCVIHHRDFIEAEYRTYSRVNAHLPELELCPDCAAVYVMAGGAVARIEL